MDTPQADQQGMNRGLCLSALWTARAVQVRSFMDAKNLIVSDLMTKDVATLGRK